MEQTSPFFKKYFYFSIFGNLFEHYENALFGLLSPFLAPLFFPNKSELVGLFFTYCIMITAILSKPFGAYVFGKIGDKKGRKIALSTTILGMSFSTAFIGCIPAFSSIGTLAPIFLTLAKISQNFFSAGETIGGAIFLLENYPGKRKNFYSSLYGASSIAGILLASFVISIFSYLHILQSHWRLLFLFSIVLGFMGFFIRFFFDEKPRSSSSIKLKNVFKKNQFAFFTIFFVAGFSYAIFSIAFTFMNGFIPLITPFSKEQMIYLNSSLLLLDLLLLPLFGYLADIFSKEKIMLIGLAFGMIFFYPLFHLLSSPSLFSIICIRVFLVLIGISFSAPFHNWSQSLVSQKTKYTLVALAYVSGSQIIGAPASMICLWGFEKTKLLYFAGIYLSIFAAIVFFILLSFTKKQLREERYPQLQEDGQREILDLP